MNQIEMPILTPPLKNNERVLVRWYDNLIERIEILERRALGLTISVVALFMAVVVLAVEVYR